MAPIAMQTRRRVRRAVLSLAACTTHPDSMCRHVPVRRRYMKRDSERVDYRRRRLATGETWRAADAQPPTAWTRMRKLAETKRSTHNAAHACHGDLNGFVLARPPRRRAA